MSISIKSRKAKGRKFQIEIAKYISELLNIPYGKDELIASREMGQPGTDIRLLGKAKEEFPFSIEIKHQETWAIPAWIEQAKENKQENTDWLLFCKKNRHEPIVVIDAKVFFNLYKKIIGDEKSG
jgi:hypothetical protein